MSDRVRPNLGQADGWLVVFDSDLTGDWDARLSHEDRRRGDKSIHVFRC